MLVRPSSRHAADYRQGFVGRPAAVLAAPGFADTKLRMLATSPMDRQDDIAGGFVDIGDDVDDKGAQESCWRERIETFGDAQAAARSSASPKKSAAFDDCAIFSVAGSRRAKPRHAV
jgi:hypothetical protein